MFPYCKLNRNPPYFHCIIREDDITRFLALLDFGLSTKIYKKTILPEPRYIQPGDFNIASDSVQSRDKAPLQM